MYSSAYVWAKVLGHMESRLTPQVVSTWFDDTEILELTDEKLVLYSPSSFRKDIIVRRCTGYIKEAMQEIFQLNVDVVVLDDTEIEAYRGKSQKPEFIEFNPQFTFDNFVVGSSNQQLFLWPTIRRKRITRFSFMARPASAKRTFSTPLRASCTKTIPATTSSISRVISLQMN